MISMAMLHDAQRVLKPVINRTPVIQTKGIVPGCDFYLKADCLQKTGAFKLRGAYYKIATLSDEEKERGGIACSAGNHAQGVAFAAHSHGIPSSLVTNILPCAEGKCKAGFIPLFLLLSLSPPWCASSSGGCFLCRTVLNNQSAVWFCFSGIGMRMDTMNQLFSCLMVICPSYFSTASRIPLIP